MKEFGHNQEESPAAKATRLMIAVEERPDDSELAAELAAWLAEDPDHADAWESAWATYEGIGEVVEKSEELESRETSRIRKIPWMAVAASVAAAACFVFFFGPNIILNLESDHLAGTAALEVISLEDGSTLTLGPESAVRLDFRADMRDVHLLRGEAFFEVEPDLVRPFRVHANHLTATVLGTAFAVDMQSGEVLVEVEHGRVAIDSSLDSEFAPEVLEAGDWVASEEGEALESGEKEPFEIAAWRENRLIVKDETVEAVVAAMKSYHKRAVWIRSDELRETRVSGVFKMDDPISAHRTLAKAAGGSLEDSLPGILIFRVE
ncbi:MAG: FecR domain-containing protein [Verrucomicrobiota bacterium]